MLHEIPTQIESDARISRILSTATLIENLRSDLRSAATEFISDYEAPDAFSIEAEADRLLQTLINYLQRDGLRLQQLTDSHVLSHFGLEPDRIIS